MQQALVAGDTLKFTTAVPSYPASDGWTLKLRLVPFTGSGAIPITATPSGADYQISVAASTTAAWVPGEYSWAAYVEKAGETYTVDGWVSADGRYRGGDAIAIKPDPRTVASFDNRSHARKTLALIETAIEGLKLGVESYTINGRTMTYRDLPQLIEMRERYLAYVRAEDQGNALAAGSGIGAKLHVRF